MHKLLNATTGERQFLLGNEAIARGAMEAGVAFASTYPGTPSSEISFNLFQISQETDLYFEYSTNEKVALEVAAAAATSGVRSMCIMKHVGVNVAADALMTLAYIGVKGGLVLLTADDPYMFSSQNEQDTRYYARLSGLPMLEPSTVDEAREMVPYAFDLSEKLGEPVLLRTTTRINHSTGVVTFGTLRERKPMGDFQKNPMSYVCVPAVSRKLHVQLLERLDRAAEIAETSEFNWLTGEGSWGVICNGVSHPYVLDATKELKIADRTRILRLGFSFPLPENRIRRFLDGCERVLVVEEGEPVMEDGVRSIAQAAGMTLPIQGKGQDLFSRLYEYDPAMVRRVMARFFDVPDTPPKKVDTADVPDAPPRPPTLCAGCSHRATFYAVKKATEGMDVMFPSDIGCYTLGFLPPLSMADYVLCMGASAGAAGGFAQTTQKKVVSFIGDSTFFHSGIPGLVNAVFNNHNITLMILDNSTTAMTGHQPHPGVDMEQINLSGYGRVSIEQVVRGIGVPHVSIVKPYKVKKSIDAIREAVEFKGVSVVLVQEACTLYARGLKLHKDRPFMVTDACKHHRNCLEELGCPAFYLEKDRVRIDPDLCSGCAVCAQICPENAIRPLKRDEK